MDSSNGYCKDENGRKRSKQEISELKLIIESTSHKKAYPFTTVSSLYLYAHRDIPRERATEKEEIKKRMRAQWEA
jgi:hypothetical protein